MVYCQTCNGTTKVQRRDSMFGNYTGCPDCKGTGMIPCQVPAKPQKTSCIGCGGKGTFEISTQFGPMQINCSHCKGPGDPNQSPSTNQFYHQPPPKETNWVGWIVLSIVGIFVLLGLANSGSGTSPRTDGVFESATKKIDEGRSRDLNQRERDRIEDLIYWCDICKQGTRTCKHGRNAK